MEEGMQANGVAITGSLVMMLNGVSHGLLPLVGTIILMVMRRCRRILRKNLKSTTVKLIRETVSKKHEGHYTLPSVGGKRGSLFPLL